MIGHEGVAQLRFLVALALVRVRVSKPEEAKEVLAQLDDLPPDDTAAKMAR